MTNQHNPKILAIQFLTPFISTAAYGGTHRPIDRIVFRQRKLVDGRVSDQWETPNEFRGWRVRVEGPSLWVTPAPAGSDTQEPIEIEIPRAAVAVYWDRSEESKPKADDKPKTEKGA